MHNNLSDSYLLEQLKLHPGTQPQDIVKMCYQATFGAEHLVADKEMFSARLEKEFSETPAAPLPLYEEISADFCRLNLSAWKQAGYGLQELIGLFFKGIEGNFSVPDKQQAFDTRMASYQETLKTIWSAEKMADLNHFLEEYHKHGLVPIHHSETYRQTERPHYLVIPTAVVKEYKKYR